MPRLHSGAAIDRPETTNTTLSAFPEFVWQQYEKTHFKIIHKSPTTETHKKVKASSSNSKVIWKNKRHQLGKPHLNYPNPIRIRSWKIKLGTRQYNAKITPRKTIMKSEKPLLE